MDSRERVTTALRGGEPDRIPCALGFFPQSLFGARDADEFFGTDVRFVEFAPPQGQENFLRYLESLPPGVHVGSAAQLRTYHEWGYHPEHQNGGGGHDAAAAWADSQPGTTASPESGVLGIAEKVAALLPRLTERSRHAHLHSAVDAHHATGLAVAGSPPHLGGELFESAWRMRGFETFMKDLSKRPTLVDYLLDQLETMAIESSCILAAAGVDVLVLDDDVAYNRGMLISPAMWRRHFKPRLARIIEAARRAAAEHPPAEQPADAMDRTRPAVLYHCDGDFTAILGDLLEIGVDAVNPVAPDCMDVACIRDTFGTRPALWGTVGTAWVWDMGTPEDIRAEVRARIEASGRKALLLSPAYDLDFTPQANVAAFIQAVREYG